jgi:flavin reductase (DIM6/NTAB) family NADH-FMN oxidoreductase RutF
MGVDAAAFRAALAQWPTGVTIVTTLHDDGSWQGMTASSFSSVSLDPPLVSVCLARSVHSHDVLAKAGVFAVSILAKDQADLGQRFARYDPAHPDRFAGGTWTTAETGCAVQPEAMGWLDCRVVHRYDGGDHTIFVGEVVAADTPRQSSPLLYHSRTWGQLADVLPDHVLLTDLDLFSPDCPDLSVPVTDIAPGVAALRAVPDLYARPRMVVTGAFDLAPSAVADAVGALMAEAPVEVVLADTTGTAIPIAVRETCREILARGRAVPVAVRLTDESGYGQANLLVALKSGVHRVDVGARALPRSTVEHLARGLDLVVIDTTGGNP